RERRRFETPGEMLGALTGDTETGEDRARGKLRERSQRGNAEMSQQQDERVAVLDGVGESADVDPGQEGAGRSRSHDAVALGRQRRREVSFRDPDAYVGDAGASSDGSHRGDDRVVATEVADGSPGQERATTGTLEDGLGGDRRDRAHERLERPGRRGVV